MIVDKQDSRATAEGEKSNDEVNLLAAKNELERLAKYVTDVHTSCDFLLKNFDVRQTARDQEVEALQQAKAILSGADFD